MTRPGLRASGPAAAEAELLARLGLPTSASPEDVDDLHQSASEYLAAAPSYLREWAHAQTAALDEAYLQLTDPVGLQGSALRSPISPPAVVPGGPATPPVRRGSDPAAAPTTVSASAAVTEAGARDEADPIDPIVDEPDLVDLEALYASVTPSAHRDMMPGARASTVPSVAPGPVPATARRRVVTAPVVAPVAAPQGANPWKRAVIIGVAVIALSGAVFGVYQMGAGAGTPAASGGTTAQATPGAPAVDQAKIAELMTKLQANPKDTVALLALANEYYAGQKFELAGQFLDKLLAIEPENIQALLARGAVSFNLGDLTSAEATWKKVVAIDPKNVEVHYDLGFLYLNQTTPDWEGVKREWSLVIELDPGSDLAKTVQSHLDSLASSSMLPGGSPSASPAASPAASAPAASPGVSPAASTVP